MYKVVILPIAKKDIKESFVWYNSRQKGLGKRFTKEVRNTTKLICLNPTSFSIRYDNVRTTILKTFPFMIHYIIDNDMIVVIAIFHTSRNPNILKNRK